MSEHEPIEKVQSTALVESDIENDEHPVDSDIPSETLPAKNNDKCLKEVIDSSKALDTEAKVLEEVPASTNAKPQSQSPVKADEAGLTDNCLSNASEEPPCLPSKEPAEDSETCIKSDKTSSDHPVIEDPKLTENHPATKAPDSDNHSEEQIPTESKSPSEHDQNVLETTSADVPTDSKEQLETTQSSEEYAEHVTYNDAGIAIYTDPKTQYKYKWCEVKNNWIALDEDTNPTARPDGSQKSNPYENEHYRWCTKTNQWIAKTTSSETETEHYRWDAEKNEWILKSQVSLDNVTYGYEDGVRTRTDKDGAVFFWDEEKKAWFPKIDDDFMARYQMSYGFIDNTSVPAAAEEEEEQKEVETAKVEEVNKVDVPAGGVKRKAPQEPPKWFELDQKQNTKVYVSNLPLDVTMDEFTEIMSKCGMIMRDPETQKHKLKLYREANGQIKGDGLCDYIKVESVDLALKLLDESVVRGNKIRVQRAQFQMRGEYNPTLKPKRKKKDKEKLLKMKEKLFDWRPEKMRGERSKHEKIVIIKNLFAPELFDKEVQLIIDYQNDLREECSKCGTVRKVVIYDRHAEGVAQVNMADPDQADLVVQMMNGRFFGKRKLAAEIWDGKTKYKIAETEKEVAERISKWDKYLESDEGKAEKARLTASESTEVDSDEAKESAADAPPA